MARSSFSWRSTPMVRKSDRSSVRQRGLEHGPSFHVVHIPLNEALHSTLPRQPSALERMPQGNRPGWTPMSPPILGGPASAPVQRKIVKGVERPLGAELHGHGEPTPHC